MLPWDGSTGNGTADLACSNVGTDGIAPPTARSIARRRQVPCIQTKICRKGGGARRDRTDDLLLAKQALSQLSYGPVLRIANVRQTTGRQGKTGHEGRYSAVLSANGRFRSTLFLAGIGPIRPTMRNGRHGTPYRPSHGGNFYPFPNLDMAAPPQAASACMASRTAS